MRGNDEGSTTSPGDGPSVLVVAGDPQDIEGLTRVLGRRATASTRRAVPPRGWHGSGGPGSIWWSGTPLCRRTRISPGVAVSSWTTDRRRRHPAGPRQEAANHLSMQQLIDATPLGRTGRSEEIASVVAFMLSDESSFLSGVDILVDGGVYAAVRDR